MSLLSKVKTGLNTTLATLILSTGISAQPIEPAQNWPYDQPIVEPTYTQETLPEVIFDFSNTDSTNTISAEIINGEQIKDLGFIVLSEDSENQFSNINWQSLTSIYRDTLNATSSPFIYLPNTSNIALLGKDFQDNILFLAESTYVHENRRTIIIDRNDTEETLYMVEGSGPYSLAYIVSSTLISSGLRDPEHETPLGFFHIYAESFHQYCSQYDCYIDMASWITRWDRGFDVGIHKGYRGTDYGRPASHGCIRVPDEFIERLWGWRGIGDNVAIIGNSLSREDFVGRFPFHYYEPFQYIISSLEQYREDVKFGNVTYGFYLRDDPKFLNDVILFDSLTNRGCQRWEPVEYGGDLLNFVKNGIIRIIYGYNPEIFNIPKDS